MKPALSLSLLFASLSASCGTVRHWRELQTDPMSIGAAWEGFVQVAASQRDGFLVDQTKTDRGLGIWQSLWRNRQSERYPIRYRLKAEFLFDEGSPEEGWLLRYVVEQEKVKDIRRHVQPSEDDWSADGQNVEVEDILTYRLQYRLAPTSIESVKPGQR